MSQIDDAIISAGVVKTPTPVVDSAIISVGVSATSGNGANNNQQQQQPAPTVICHACGTPGHKANECPNRAGGQQHQHQHHQHRFQHHQHQQQQQQGAVPLGLPVPMSHHHQHALRHHHHAHAHHHHGHHLQMPVGLPVPASQQQNAPAASAARGIVCYACGAPGHKSNECPKRGQAGGGRGGRGGKRVGQHNKGIRVRGHPTIKPDEEAAAEFEKIYENLERPAGGVIASLSSSSGGKKPIPGSAIADDSNEGNKNIPTTSSSSSAAATSSTRPPVGFVGLLDVERVLRTIEAHDVTFVTTDTGTGKSTLIPKALYDTGARVVCAESRRTATIKLAERVADLIQSDKKHTAPEELHATLGKTVGYKIRGEYVGTEETPIMFMTSYTLFLWLLGNPTDFKYTHILIDDFHERPPDIEVTMSLLRLAMQKKQHTKPFKIVLMSATVQLEHWAEYFNGMKVGTYSTVVPRYPIHTMPLERTLHLIGLDTPAPNLKKETATALEIQQMLFVAKGLLMFLAGKGNPSDSILVFVPGRMYVELLCSFCEEHLAEHFDPVEWYRDVDVHDLERAFERTHLTKRKVYVATDIAEISVTLPDVVFVIDLCLSKKPRIVGRGVRDIAFPPLETFWATQTSLAQRKGRLGRVQSGFYFNMIPEGSERHLPSTVPHICNSRVDELSLHLLQIADRPTEVLRLCFASPSPLSLWLSRGILQDNGLAFRKDDHRWKGESFDTVASAEWSKWLEEESTSPKTTTATKNISAASSSDAKIQEDEVEALPPLATTAKGKIAQFLPLAVQPSLVVWSGLIFGIESLAVLAAAICSAGSPFYVFGLAEFEGREYAAAISKAEDAMKKFVVGEIKSDIITAVNAMVQYKVLSQNRSTAELEAWLDENQMHPMRVDMIVQLEKQIADQLAQQVTYFSTVRPEDLQQQLENNSRVLNSIVVSAFSSNAILVNRNPVEAQKARSAGHGVFLEFGALRDRNVPSVVEWELGQVAIPCVVQRRSDLLFGYFSMSLSLTDFCAIQAMCNHTVTFHEIQNTNSTLCSFELMTVRRAIQMENNYAQTLRLLRDLIGLRTQQQVAILRHGVAIDNVEGLKAVFAEIGMDDRVPLPQMLSEKIRQLMNTLLSLSPSCRAVGPDALAVPNMVETYSTLFGGSSSSQRYTEKPLPAEKMPTPPPKAVEEAAAGEKEIGGGEKATTGEQQQKGGGEGMEKAAESYILEEDE